MLTCLSPSTETGVLVFFSPADFMALFFELPPPAINEHTMLSAQFVVIDVKQPRTAEEVSQDLRVIL